ncbi:MAG: chemotaxis protein CheX [Deltaproteobacteria bacterium]|nr:chemotaxis protein CheX [Deltaproteobacteria bacterium]
MDVKLINPFLDATVEVLKKMAFVEPRPGKVYLKTSSVAYGDVSGIIGITGDATGSLAISFSESCICHLIAGMLGEPCTEANQDVFDGVGEITNMISGAARTRMEKDGMEVYAAIPSVIYGKDHMINHILKSPSIVIPFVTDHGSFVADVCIRRTTEDVKVAENYQVLNKKTVVQAPQYEAPNKQNTQKTDAAPTLSVDKKELLTKKLHEITAMRDDMVKQLSEKPFMQISQRQLLKKQIPILDAQIKRLRLDISTIAMLSNLTKDDIENPKVVQHYQHYEPSKRKP